MTTTTSRSACLHQYVTRHIWHNDVLTLPSGLTCHRSPDDPLSWDVATRNGVLIQLVQMIFNWRVTTTPVDLPQIYSGGWCYFGLGYDTFERALTAAHTWDPRPGTAPEHHDKEILPFEG